MIGVMSQAAHPVRYSFADYVALERASNVKHEHLDGQIYAMAGGTPEHAALVATVSGLLFAQLRGKPCRVYSSDLRVRASDLTTYPDVTVVCGPVQGDADDPNTVLNPTLVVEVTSPSTEEYDRGEKLGRYQEIETLSVVVIVSHREASIDVFRRGDQAWERSTARHGDTVALSAIGCSLKVDEIYQRT
jgi:Uma2 family endonuclease